MDLHEAAEKRLEELEAFLGETKPPILEADKLTLPAEPEGANDSLVDALAHKAILFELKRQLDAQPSLAQRFKASTGWPLLNQMLTAARLRELAQVKIVKKGGGAGLRFDITELVGTYYGKQILTGLKFNVSRRRVVDKKEFASIQDALKVIKLTLPEAVDPTTTEKFFAAP